MKKVYLGVDLGGTKIHIGCADSEGKILSSEKFKTAKSGQGIINQIITFSDNLVARLDANEYRLDGVGIGVPGVYRKDGGIDLCPNIAEINLNPVKSHFFEKYSVYTGITNDVKCAALGEAWLGSGRNIGNFVFLNMGTGISAGIVINGNIYEGRNGASGEVAYMVTDPGKKRGFRSNKTPLEEIFSGKGIEDTVKKKAGIETNSILRNLVIRNNYNLDTKLIFKAAREGDEKCKKILDNALKHAFAAITNLCIVLNPEALILGGGVSMDYDYFSKDLNNALNEFVPYPPRVLLAELGTDAGLYGAICLGKKSAEN